MMLMNWPCSCLDLLRRRLYPIIIATSVLVGAGEVNGNDKTNTFLAELRPGHFDRILSLLDHGQAETSNAQVADLVRDLHRHQAHTKRWIQDRQDAYQFAYAQMAALSITGHIEDAMGFAIEAHGLAVEEQAIFEDPNLIQLVDQATENADKASQAGDWVKAASLYRRLDLLFDDPASAYRENSKKALRHLHVMRTYIPQQLKTLYEQRAMQRGEQIDPINLGDDPWNKRLSGITRQMLIRAFVDTRESHVNSIEFKQLLEGAIEALLVLVNTQGLEQAFATLNDQEAVVDFRNYLIAQRDLLDDTTGIWTLDELKNRINDIFRENQATVQLDMPVLVYEMTSGAMETLDEFTAVIWPYDLEQFRRNTKGSFYGVGIQISMTPGPLSVIDLPFGSPPYQAGLRNQDALVQINGRDISDYSPRYVMWRLSQIDDQPITVSIERENAQQLMTITLTTPAAVKIKRSNGRLNVKSPLRGTPAYQAGIRANDIIASVNGQPTKQWTLGQAVRNITGPEHTNVTLGIERKGQVNSFDVEIERAEIGIESVKGWQLNPNDTWDYYIDRDRRIGYIRLTQFIPQSSDDMVTAIKQMQDDDGLDALIMDLRFNPGGLLNKAVDVTNLFLRSGVIVSTIDGNGDESDTRRAMPHKALGSFPLVVIINQGSASASEIVSGALQDYARGTIIGTRSYGKGSVQDLFPIDTGRTAHLKLTTQYYRLPSKRIIHRTPQDKHWGIEPDFEVKMTDDQVRTLLKFRQELDVLYRNEDPIPPQQTDATVFSASRILTEGMDPQLEAALLLLKTHMVAGDLELASQATVVNMP